MPWARKKPPEYLSLSLDIFIFFYTHVSLYIYTYMGLWLFGCFKQVLTGGGCRGRDHSHRVLGQYIAMVI